MGEPGVISGSSVRVPHPHSHGHMGSLSLEFSPISRGVTSRGIVESPSNSPELLGMLPSKPTPESTAISPCLPGVTSGWLDMVVPTNSHEFLGLPVRVISWSPGVTPVASESLGGAVVGPKPSATQVPGVFPEPWVINLVRAACQAWGLLPAPDLCSSPVLLEGVTPRVATGTISPFLPGVTSGWLVMVVPTNSHEFLGFPVRVIGWSPGVTPAASESLCGGAVGPKPPATQVPGVFPEPWVLTYSHTPRGELGVISGPSVRVPHPHSLGHMGSLTLEFSPIPRGVTSRYHPCHLPYPYITKGAGNTC